MCIHLAVSSQSVPTIDNSLYKYDLSLIAPEQLSQFSNISELEEDAMGFLWFLSKSGLHCFDGKTVLTYNNKGRDDFFGLTTEGTGYSMLVISHGKTLWALEGATGAIVGIDLNSRSVIKRISFREEYKGFRIKMSAERDGNAFAITQDYVTEEIFLHCLSCENAAPKLIGKGKELIQYRIHEDDHWLKFGTGDLCKMPMNGAKMEKISSTYYLRLAGEKNSKLEFLETSQINLFHFQGKDTMALVPSFPKKRAEEFTEVYHYQNEFWFTNTTMGLVVFDESEKKEIDYSPLIKELVRLESPSSLSFNLSDFQKMNNGDFLASFSNGILKLNLKSDPIEKFQENIQSGNSLTSMRGIGEDQNGNIYASYYTGVKVKLNGENQFQSFRDTDTRKNRKPRTYALTVWKNKLIWNNIVFDLASQNQDYFYSKKYGEHISHYLEADTLWAYEWFDNMFVSYDLVKEKSKIIKKKMLGYPDYVSTLLLDEKTQLFWISSFHHGLQVFNKKGEIVKDYSAKELGLPENKIAIFELEQEGDTIWFCTEIGLGLLNKKNNESKILTTKVGDFNGNYQYNSVFSILKTEGNFFYLGTQRGIVRFDKRTFQFDNLSPEHPLASIEFNRGSSFQASDGKIYFGSVDGLYSFYPDELEFERSTGLDFLSLTFISIYNANLDENVLLDKGLHDLSLLKLKYSDTNVKINFSAPSTEKVFYKYRISELMKDWSPYTQNGTIEVTSFPVGDFDIEIKASNTPNLNDENQPVLTFKVSKPNIWYKKTWVILLAFLSGLGLIFLRIRSSFQEKLARRQELELLRVKISSDLHDDVGSILTGIAMQSEVMSLGKNEEEKKPLSELSGMSRDAMDRMRDIVWALDSRKDKYENLIDRMRSFIRQSLGKKNIAHDFKLINIDASKFLNPNIRQQLYLIFKEAITNIVKHSDGTEVVITLAQDKEEFILIIHDNGSEKPLENSDGLGTQNMKMRAEDIGGSFKFSYQNGYRVAISVKTK